MQRNKSVRDFLSGRVLPETKISELTVCKINFTNKADSSRIASSFHLQPTLVSFAGKTAPT